MNEDNAKAAFQPMKREDFQAFLDKAAWDAFAELEHEISRVRRRIAEGDPRREYLEGWIADYERRGRDLLGWIAERASRGKDLGDD